MYKFSLGLIVVILLSASCEEDENTRSIFDQAVGDYEGIETLYHLSEYGWVIVGSVPGEHRTFSVVKDSNSELEIHVSGLKIPISGTEQFTDAESHGFYFDITDIYVSDQLVTGWSIPEFNNHHGIFRYKNDMERYELFFFQEGVYIYDWYGDLYEQPFRFFTQGVRQ